MRQDNPVTATLAGLFDRGKRRPALPPLRDDERLDGRTALVTGASSGLGFAIATALAGRGARVLMVCRSRIPEAGDAVKAATGGEVEMIRADLSDLGSIRDYCDGLAERGERVDVAVFNAGVMPRRARRTRHGVEEMRQVNFLAKVAQTRRLLASGVIPSGRGAPVDATGGARPRIVLVSSEAHRSARPLEIDRLDQFVDYGLSGGMAEYAHSKLLLNTWAAELARRLSHDGESQVGVYALCPGAVATRIAREAPFWIKPVIGPVMKRFFQSPAKAARPVAWLACAEAMEGETGVYLHMTERKPTRQDTLAPENGRALWEAANDYLDRLEGETLSAAC